MPTSPRPEKEEARNRRSEAEADLSSVAESGGGKESRATERGMIPIWFVEVKLGGRL